MAQTEQGRVLSSVAGVYMVETPRGDVPCKARGIFRKQGISPAAGDLVQIEEQVITQIMPRRNYILRPPAANLDMMFFVVATTQPVPNLMLLDSFVTVAIYLQIEPVILLTKTDLSSPAPLCSLYQRAGVRVLCVDYAQPETVEQVKALLKGRVCLMTGNSGVGKSTLLNAIDPALSLETAQISTKLGRGRHTTRTVQLYRVCGGYLADTPGFSTFEVEQYVQMKKERIADCFPEFAPYLGKCRFQDCAHVKEKDCAVLAAVAEGRIAKSRHDAYVSLYEIARSRKDWA